MNETDPYFLKFFQSNATVCLIIHLFCKSCESEIVVFVLIWYLKVIGKVCTFRNPLVQCAMWDGFPSH